MHKSRHLFILIGSQPQIIVVLFLIMLLKTNLYCHVLRSHRSSRSTRGNSEHYRVNFILPDELPANHFIGNIPSQLPQFPFGTNSDLSVSTTLTDAVNMAPRLLRTTDSGDLFTLVTLDRDNREQICGPLNCCRLMICNFTVDVLFVHPKMTALTVHVNLQFHDSNDNSPIFPQQIYSLWIAEDNGLTTTTDQLISRNHYELPAATDLDSDPNGIVEYKLTGDKLVINTFQLDSNVTEGKLSLSLRSGFVLDYEKLKDHILKLTIQAIDGGQPQHTTQMLLVIHVLDLNDNPPVFNRTTDNIEVIENTVPDKPIYVIHAYDADSDDNALIRYSFGLGNPNMPSNILNHFSFHPTTGQLRIRKALDYEQYAQRLIELRFIAQDAGNPPLSSAMKLIIHLKDVNDNAPQLIVQSNHTIVEHTAPGQLALRLLVRDLDEISRHSVKCSPDPDQRVPLRLENSPDHSILSIFTTTSLDYEMHPSFYYSITCIDNAEPRKIIRFNLTIAVQDTNDNIPVFRFPSNTAIQGQYNVTISEGEPVNKLILIVQADDADSGDFGRVTYSLFEAKETSVALTATSKTLSKQVSLVSFENYFKIDPETGSIFLIKRLDYEKTENIVFGVMAKDGSLAPENSRKSATALVVVHILDINDNAPYLKSSDHIKITEHLPVGTNIGTVQFLDPDTGPAGEVTVRGIITSFTRNQSTMTSKHDNDGYNAEMYFKLTDDQHIVTINSIDREQTPRFVLRILAVDNGYPIQLAVTASVTISVIDINDNSPVMVHPKPNSTVNFSPVKVEDVNNVPLYQIEQNQLLTKSSISGASLIKAVQSNKQNANKILNSHVSTNILYQIRGDDADTGENARISYFLIPNCNGSQYFHVEPETGYIRNRLRIINKTITKELSMENDITWIPLVGNYMFCVRLSDHGKPPLSSVGYFWFNITPAISKALVKAMWPSDSAEYATLGVENLDLSVHNSVVNQNLSRFSQVDNTWGQSDIGVSNVIISLLVAIFAVTLFCALAASVIWAHSKRRKSQLRSVADTKQQPKLADRSAFRCDADKDDNVVNPLLNGHLWAQNTQDLVFKRNNGASLKPSRQCPLRLSLTSLQANNETTTPDSVTCSPIRSTFRSTNLCDLIPPNENEISWQHSPLSTINEYLQASSMNSLTTCAKALCTVQLTPKFSSTSLSDQGTSSKPTNVTSTITQILNVIGSSHEPFTDGTSKAITYPIVGSLPRPCPKHGPHYLLHSEAPMAEQYEISLPTTIYTLNEVLKNDNTSGFQKTEVQLTPECPPGFDTIYSNSPQTAAILDKTISWVPLPLISESIETHGTDGFLYIDPLKPVELETDLPQSQIGS